MHKSHDILLSLICEVQKITKWTYNLGPNLGPRDRSCPEYPAVIKPTTLATDSNHTGRTNWLQCIIHKATMRVILWVLLL